MGDVLVLTLARPEKKNALSDAMYDALIHGLAEADRQALGAILIRGSQGVFSAGQDLEALARLVDFAQAPALRFLRALARCETPLVAAVDGLAIGVGFTLLLQCDLVYATPESRFRAPFIDLGLVPEAGSSLLLPERLGRARAAALLLLGDELSAPEAERLGLVNTTVPSADLPALALEKAQRLAAKPRGALRSARRLLRGDPEALLARIDEEAVVFATLLKSAATREAIAAVLGGRNG
jgi:enoyl-CoA hydratase/carnithine racemase